MASTRRLTAILAADVAGYLRQQHRSEEAIAEYEIVITFNRNLPQVYAHLGRSKFNAGFIEEMIPSVEHAIRLSPRDPDLHQWYTRIGLVHLLQLRTDEAIVWFENARTANPEQSLHHNYLCSGCALKGDIARAAGQLAEACRLSGDGRFTSLTPLKAVIDFGAPSARTLYEGTYLLACTRLACRRNDGQPGTCGDRTVTLHVTTCSHYGGERANTPFA
jgi:tetratricopeptide (TPR) repeat protein